MDLFSPEILIPLVSQHAALLLCTLPGLVIFGYLANRAVFEGKGMVQSKRFSRGDIFIAAFLVLLFLGYIVSQPAAPAGHAKSDAAAVSVALVIANIFLFEIIFLGIAAGPMVAMKLRGMSLREAFGWRQRGPVAVVGLALGFLLLALPLIAVALDLSRILLAAWGNTSTEPQEMVLFLEKNPSLAARVAVAISAVVFAPFQEELVFRGYLYGVARRYVGPAGGAVLVSLLFAAIHVHAPSFAGLFVLAMCLTLAYEWSGSLLVPMMMHAMFNSITVISLLAGGPDRG